MDIIARASEVYKANFPPVTWFERAIFISWFCAKPTCKFCYMYTIRGKASPNKARRRLESIFAEALISRICGWEIGFISGGIASWSTYELKPALKGIFNITGKKQWLNLGAMKETQIIELLPYLEGVTGTVECPNENLRKHIVPDKPLSKIEEMFAIADKYKIKKSITIIIGLWETIEDFKNLKLMIERWKIDRLNFYRLVPHKGAELFPQGPKTEYYAEWIATTRIAFPRLQIIAGSWPDKTAEVETLLRAGANAITKFPAIKLFGKKPAFEIEYGAKKAGRKFKGTLTSFPKTEPEKELKKAGFNSEIVKKTMDRYKSYSKHLGIQE